MKPVGVATTVSTPVQYGFLVSYLKKLDNPV